MAGGSASVRSMIMGFFQGSDGTALAVTVAVVLIAITTVLILLLRGRVLRGQTVLLVGLSDSGKTLLFSRLSTGKHVMSHTSIKENKGTHVLKGSKSGQSLALVDLPGHERVRSQFLEQYKNQAKCLLFVIDSVNFPREVQDVAEHMYDILSDRTLTKGRIPILVVCNKQDITTAKSQNVIKSQLEKEMNTLRVTKSAALQGLDGSENNVPFLGKKGKDFDFSQVLPVKVDFTESSAKGVVEGDADLSALEKWLEDLA